MVSLLIAVVVMAIVFDYINGFHDAANAIATVVSTGVLPIRTAVLKDRRLHVQAAAGVVADSDPAAEWQETRHKARALLAAAEQASGEAP